jgi:hypothetical protein
MSGTGAVSACRERLAHALARPRRVRMPLQLPDDSTTARRTNCSASAHHQPQDDGFSQHVAEGLVGAGAV